jgi:alpha-glucuronidase
MPVSKWLAHAPLWLLPAAILSADTGRDAWLRYAATARSSAQNLPAVIASAGDSDLIHNARQELLRGVRGMLGRSLRVESGMPHESAILLGTLASLPDLHLSASLAPDAYWLKTTEVNGNRYLVVTAADDRGVLYGAFALLRKIALGEPIGELDEIRKPFAPIRWVNQWDNLDGAIERGYGGRSIFWENFQARADLSRASEYGRLLASLGLNGCAINNVNANPRLLSFAMIAEVARIANVLRPWGVRTAISVDFGSPKTVGGLDTFDPLDPRVAAWWKAKADEIHGAVPDLAGFVLKADSEGRVGPSAYGRTHADAANVVARALAPHGGLLLYRGFVYDRHMDWRNPKNDRARAAYDNFQPLDGQFDANVILQIKHGPIDFQVREPASPLFYALKKTNRAVELQIAQEYMGQARHTVFLVPMWKETMDLHLAGSGMVGVANVGLDENWTGNQLSQANLYGFGRLAWNPDLTARQIVDEWTRLTFSSDPKVMETLARIQLSSWRTYENYTGPLGLQTLTEITGSHYGPAVEASERNGWGQWHRADEHGVGMDRTMATGTGYIGQYPAAIAKLYESISTCPDDLLLFMHHVPYTHILHSGNSVIQYIYDSHYEGAAAAEEYARAWKSLRGRVDDQRFAEVLAQFEYQAGHAELWRDAVTSWFLRTSGIPDARGRAGHYPGRVEAESMKLEGYMPVPIVPWESASGGKAVECPETRCTAGFRFQGAPGWYTLRVRYFDQPVGASQFGLRVANQLVDQWTANDHLPARKVDGAASTRRVVRGVALRPGDEIRVEGVPDGAERAVLDYVEVAPE